MSRQSNYARNSFFRQSMARAEMLQKKRKNLQQLKGGEVVEDPKTVVETEDSVEDDPKEVVE